MQKWAKQSGFTIVELLIVVVVIAILAAVTIIAYNGIQNRARTSAVSSAASQAGRQLLTYAPVNGDTYPTEAQFQLSSFRLGTLKLPEDTPEATYDYFVSDDQKSFCLSVTNTNASPEIAYAMTQEGSEVPGRCVENFVANPSFEVDRSGWYYNTPGLHGMGGTPSTPTTGYTGQNALRYTFNGSGYFSGFGPYTQVANLSPGTPYSMSVWVRASMAASYGIVAERRNASNASIGTISSSALSVGPSGWTRIQLDIPPTTDLSKITFCIYGSASSVVSGDYVEWDGAMLTAGAEATYYPVGADSNWAWKSTANTQPVFGPALLQ